MKQTPPNFTQHEVAVPFGCSPEQIQSAILKFLVDLITQPDMRQVQKLFFVPVGLPGMGKSTLAKNIRLSVEKNLSFDRQNPKKVSLGAQLPQASNLTSMESQGTGTDAATLNLSPS